MAIPDDSERLNPTRFDPDFAAPPQWAAMYRAAGFQVVPCKDKRPALHEWKEFQNELIAQSLFDVWYGAGGKFQALGNMGVITGPCSGNLFVIDLDLHKTPQAASWWRAVMAEENSGLDPETPEQRTGGGGIQKLFRAPNGVVIPTIRTDKGVDIRGTGGFAVLPPTLHQSGRNYAWLPLAGPWERPVAMAEPWLIDAVCSLAEAHSGEAAAAQMRTPSPGSDYTAFGLRQDGRETEMRDVVFRATLELYRKAPIPPSGPEAEAACAEAYALYESRVVSRLGIHDKQAGLEQEGRGVTAFRRKWAREMRLWGSPKMVREAAKPAPEGGPANTGFSGPPPEPPKVDPKTGKPLPLILTAEEFVEGYTPPAYIINGLVQRGYLYSLTAKTGHGKTALAMYMAQCIARGVDMHGHRVRRGTVLMLAGENPDDIRARYLVLAEACGFDPATLAIRFIAGVIDIAARLPEITAVADTINDLVLVIVDTAAAYFPGDEDNSNTQKGAFARLLRRLTFLKGKPTVLVNCHPVKNAGRDNLIPVGGGAFLNEVDGNLTIWATNEKQLLLHWQGKFRGPEFDPIAFELVVATSPRVVDAEGRSMPSVVANPISDTTLEAGEVVRESDEDKMLMLIHKNPGASFTALATKAGYVDLAGAPVKYRVQRIVERLRDDKMVERHRAGKYQLTRKGKREIGVDKDDDE